MFYNTIGHILAIQTKGMMNTLVYTHLSRAFFLQKMTHLIDRVHLKSFVHFVEEFKQKKILLDENDPIHLFYIISSTALQTKKEFYNNLATEECA